MRCYNSKNAEDKAVVETLTLQTGSENLARKIWDINNGYPLDTALNGKPSLLTKSINILYPDKSIYARNMIKAYIFSDDFINQNGNWFVGDKYSKVELDENGEPMLDVHELSNFIYFRNGEQTKVQLINHLDTTITAIEDYNYENQLTDVFQEIVPVKFTDKELFSLITEVPKGGVSTVHKHNDKMYVTKTSDRNEKTSIEGHKYFGSKKMIDRFNTKHERTKAKYGVTFDLFELNTTTWEVTLAPTVQMAYEEYKKLIADNNKVLESNRFNAKRTILEINAARLTKLKEYRDSLNEDNNKDLKSIATETETEVEMDLIGDLTEESFRKERATNAKQIIGVIGQRIDKLQSKITNALSNQDKDILLLRIKRLKDDILLLNSDLSFENIALVAERQLNEVQQIVDNNRNLNYSDLLNALYIVDNWTWEKSASYLTQGQIDNEYNEFHMLFDTISSKAQKLSTALSSTITKKVLLDVQNDINPSANLESLLEIRASGVAVGQFLDIGKQNSDLVQYIDLLLKKLKRNQIGKVNEINERIADTFANLDGDTNYIKYFKKDKDGNVTNKLTNNYSDEYFDYLKLRKKSRNFYYTQYKTGVYTYARLKEKLNKLDEDYRKNIIVIDTGALINGEKPKMNPAQTKQEYIDYLHKVLGKEITDLAIAEAELKNSEYLNDKRLFEEQLILAGENVEQEMLVWEEEHSPHIYINNIYGVKKNYKNQNDGYRYTVSIPKVQNLKGEKTAFYDPNFVDIMSNPKTAKFYNEFKVILLELKDMLPDKVKDNLPDNMLPSIKRTLLDVLIADGLIGTVDSISDKMMTYVTSNEPATLRNRNKVSTKDRDAVTKRPLKSITLEHLNQIASEDMSTDLNKILRAFTRMAVDYRFKSELEDKILTLNRILLNTREVEIDSRLRRTFDKYENKYISYKDGNQTMKDAVQYAIDSLLYDEHKEQDKGMKPVITSLNPLGNLHGLSDKFTILNKIDAVKKKKQRLDLEIRAEALDRQLEAEEITDEEHAAQMANYEQQYEALGARHLSYIAVGETAIKWTQLKGLALNAPAGVANLLFGIASNFTHSNARLDFNVSTLLKAQGMIIKNIVSKKPSKVFNLVRMYDVLFDVIDSRYGTETTPIDNINGSKREKVIRKVTKFEPYMFQTKGEYFIQASSFIAHMLYSKITTSEGTEISVFDAYNEDGTWRKELFDGNTNEQWNNIIESGNTTNEFTKFRDKSIEINKNLHGNYDPASRILIKRTVLGRMFMQFRSWAPEGVANRYLSERRNTQLGRTTKGRYITYGDLGAVGSIKTLMKQMMYYNNPEKAFDLLIDKKTGKINPRDIENMRKNLAELGALASFVMLNLLIGLALTGDDDESVAKKRVLLVLYNKIFRAQQDIYFYIDPNSALNVLQTPIPAVRAFTDLSKAINRSYKELYDSEYNGYPASYYWAKTFPITNQVAGVKFLATHKMNK